MGEWVDEYVSLKFLLGECVDEYVSLKFLFVQTGHAKRDRLVSSVQSLKFAI